MAKPRPGLILDLFLRASRVQKRRAVLTVAAIAWGSLSLLLLLSFGEGLRRQLWLASQGMGRDLAVLWPGSTSRPWKGLPPGRPVRPRIEDVAFLRERIPSIEAVAGEIHDWRVVLTAGRKTVTGHVIGVDLAYGEMRNHIPLPGGRFLDRLDEERRRRAVFLGGALAENLFGEADAVGETLLVAGVPYTVVGVMKPKMMMGNYGGMDEDHAVIPISTFRTQFGEDRLSNLIIRPDDPSKMSAVLREVHEALGQRHGFDPGDDRAFMIWDTVETSRVLTAMLVGIQAFLGIIGGLTLTIGGVGVANIMYAVVRERTREIGVQMTLGARPSWITWPIVLEGVLYTFLGGAFGLVMALGVIVALGAVPTEGNEALRMLGKPTLSLPIAVASAAVLGTIGVLAGYFPARRAAAVDPARTLRHE